jgi:hypothetical protein
MPDELVVELSEAMHFGFTIFDLRFCQARRRVAKYPPANALL